MGGVENLAPCLVLAEQAARATDVAVVRLGAFVLVHAIVAMSVRIEHPLLIVLFWLLLMGP